MAHSNVAYLLEVQNKSSPSLVSLLREFLFDTFSHQRHLRSKIEDAKAHGHLTEAASYAIGLRQYDHAFTLYNQDIANGNSRTNISAAELAESLGNYKKGLEYRVQAEDYAFAGVDAARLGRREEAQQYWRKLREE